MDLTIVAPAMVVVFKLLSHWKEDYSADVVQVAKKFSSEPTYDNIYISCLELFQLTEQDLFSAYVLRGVKDGQHFDLTSQNFAFGDGCHVEIVPRYHQATFHIVSLAIEYSRLAIQKKCKELNIAGDVTRDNVNSLKVRLCHPDLGILSSAIDDLDKLSSSPCVDRENMKMSFGYGTLSPSVLAHKGTAKRSDGVRSWVDDDVCSGSTYFNAPVPATKPKASSLGARLAYK